MTTSSHDEFLADLYAMDPGLREHEAELIPLITKLLKNDPATSPDPAFVAKLRSQLGDKAATMDVPAAGRSWNLSWLLGGALTAAVMIPVAFVAYNGLPKTVPAGEDGASAPAFAYRIEDAEENAFGNLTDIAPASPERSARPQSGGGGMGGDIAVQSNPVPSEAPMGMDAKMIAPYPMYQYEYVYDGELPELTPTVPVYKHDSSRKNLPLSAISSRLNLGTLNLDSFSGMNIDSLSFNQNVPFGLQLYVNLRDSSINIDANWEQWPQSKCTTEACFRNEQVKIGDVPANEQLIAIAKDFAAAHGIDLSHYGEPEVDMQWKTDYERAKDKSMAYVPETQRVVFPLLIDGKPVHDQSGMKAGISIGVHAKHKRVMNVYGVMDRAYIKSEYAGVTSADEVKKFLAQIDNYGAMPVDLMRTDGGAAPEVKKGKVILGEPTVSYSLYYRYTTGTNEELLVPSLIFPIKSVEGGEEGFFYRSSVVVPLASEMIKQQDNTIRPMMEGAMVK